VDNAKAALRQAELTLGDSDLKAPFSGFLLIRYIELEPRRSLIARVYDCRHQFRKSNVWRARLCAQPRASRDSN